MITEEIGSAFADGVVARHEHKAYNQCSISLNKVDEILAWFDGFKYADVIELEHANPDIKAN